MQRCQVLYRPSLTPGHQWCRVPEEAPQEIADLIKRCVGPAEERPSAQECIEIIGPIARLDLPATRSRSATALQVPSPGVRSPFHRIGWMQGQTCGLPAVRRTMASISCSYMYIDIFRCVAYLCRYIFVENSSGQWVRRVRF